MKELSKEKKFAKVFLYSIHQVYVLVQRRMEKKLNEAGALSFSQFWVLVCFIDCKEETEQIASQVAKKMYITEATLSRHIAHLVKQKLIQKKQDQTNKKKFIVSLTDKGKSQFFIAKKIIDQELEKIFNVIGKSDRQKLINNFEKLLKKLLDN